jgi:hypothetical protein
MESGGESQLILFGRSGFKCLKISAPKSIIFT